jgi:CRISPR-associated protein (TIGR02584 family)
MSAASLRQAPDGAQRAISTPMPPPLDNPASYPRRVLLALCGLSPQVVTETLYALAVAQTPQFLPTRIEIITTEEGRQRALLQLLDPEDGAFRAFCREFELDALAGALDPGAIGVIAGPGGPLADIQSEDDNRAAADTIIERIRILTADADTALHVSIAGGRKTGFLAGHALSLFGRPQDRLSHVLVAESFVTHPDFFYPPRRPRMLYDRMNRPVRTDQAQLVLADIPFLRLRGQLPPAMLADGRSYSATVAEAQAALPPLALHLDATTRAVIAGGEVVVLTPAEFAFYLMLAERRRQGLPGAHWSDPGVQAEIARSYAQVVNAWSGDYERFETAGMSKDNFNARKSHINAALVRTLGRRRAEPYLIEALASLGEKGRGRLRPYGLSLSPDAITIAAEEQR